MTANSSTLTIPCWDRDRALKFAAHLRNQGLDAECVSTQHVNVLLNDPKDAWGIAWAATISDYARSCEVFVAVCAYLEQL